MSRKARVAAGSRRSRGVTSNLPQFARAIGYVAARLRQQDLVWDLQLQPFVDEASTPIEDASVDWPTPYTTVARLTLPRQDPAADPALAEQVEAAVFDPWQALAAHRPLGDVMRARKVVYFESQKGRGAA